MKNCRQCGTEIVKISAKGGRNAVFCSKVCSRLSYKSTTNDGESGVLKTGTIGAIHEMSVSVDLMRKGFHVFRALDPSCPCDLVIVTGSMCFRVQVTKAKRSTTGNLSFASHKSGTYDILALSFVNGTVDYIPPLPVSCGDV